MALDRAQLEALKRQLEEDYRLDISAIDRLQRIFAVAGSSLPASHAAPAPFSPAAVETNTPPIPGIEPRSETQEDELTGSLRAMFSARR